MWPHNARLFKKDGLTLDGRLNKSGEMQYVTLSIEVHDTQNIPQVYIELENGEKVLLRNVSIGKLTKDNSGFMSSSLTKYPQDARYFTLGEYRFVVSENRIIAIQAYGDKVAFWDASLKKRYNFPLAHNEAIELFGNPDEVVDYTFW